METGLFEIQADYPRRRRENPQSPNCGESIHAPFRGGNLSTANPSSIEFARSFLRLANMPNFALDRLSRYEATLLRQAGRIIYALEALDRRKPQERFGSKRTCKRLAVIS
jgi:hypothetical protein